MNAFDTDLPFQVEEWDAAGNRALRTLAKCVSLEIATYVYEAALREQTDKTRVLSFGIGSSCSGFTWLDC